MSHSSVPFEEAVKRLRISCVPHSVRHRLALFLDTHSDANWEFLAEVLDISSLETQWLKDTVVNSRHGSPTFRLFDQYLMKLDITLEQFIQALEKIRNLACIRVLTEEYNNGVFDRALMELNNGIHNSVSKAILHHPVICPSLHHYQTPPTMLPSAEYLSKVYGYDLGEANFSSGSTYNSLEGVAGDSISFTHLDSYDSGDSVPRFPVPMNIALCLAEARLPTLGYENGCKGLYTVNDTPAVNRIQDAPLDLSSCYVKAEPTVKEERDRCCDLLQQNNGCRRNELPRKTQDVCAGHHRLCPHTVPALHQQRKCDIKAEGMAPVYTQSAVKPEKKMENGEQDPRRENPDCADSRSIRVFVTYSDDSKKHMKKVMQLCECLKSNNFSVSIDVRENHLLSQDKMGWFDKRFKVADYVLILISPKYYTDVTETDDCRETTQNESTLNTLYIHRCMQAEYMMNKCLNKRFVPVLMPGSTKDHVPFWLKNTTIYLWPDQYKNLFFYMMYPAQVISQFVKREQTKTPTVIKTNH